MNTGGLNTMWVPSNNWTRFGANALNGTTRIHVLYYRIHRMINWGNDEVIMLADI